MMLREQAERCRRLAEATTDRDIAAKLLDLAREFDAEADRLDEDAREAGEN
jgi:hypothetical protein